MFRQVWSCSLTHNARSLAKLIILLGMNSGKNFSQLKSWKHEIFLVKYWTKMLLISFYYKKITWCGLICIFRLSYWFWRVPFLLKFIINVLSNLYTFLNTFLNVFIAIVVFQFVFFVPIEAENPLRLGASLKFVCMYVTKYVFKWDINIFFAVVLYAVKSHLEL